MEATQLHHSGVDVLSKLMSANFVGEVCNASSGEPTQQLTHGQRRPLGRVAHVRPEQVADLHQRVRPQLHVLAEAAVVRLGGDLDALAVSRKT